MHPDPYIYTSDGIQLRILDPSPHSITIEAMAHNLSQLCRFTGHTTPWFYSVAEHSLHVSLLCDPEDAAWGLLHEGDEFIGGDVSGPMKSLPFMRGYNEWAKEMRGRVAVKFGLDQQCPPSVKRADLVMLGIEFRDVMPPAARKDPRIESLIRMAEGCTSLRIEKPLSMKDARFAFLDRFEELVGSKR